MPNAHGKITRLPFALREELNQRLLDNQPTATILDWLNALPQMIALCQEHGQEPVNPVNLSHWRNGQHLEWLRRREKVQQTQSLCQWAGQISAAGGGRLTEGISTLMAEQIFEVMEGLAKVQEEIKCLEDDAERNQRWLEISKTVSAVARALASMRGGDYDREKLLLGERALKQKAEWMALHREKFQRLVCDRLLDAAQRTKIHEIAMSDAEYEKKLEAIRLVAFADVDEVERNGELARLTPP